MDAHLAGERMMGMIDFDAPVCRMIFMMLLEALPVNNFGRLNTKH